MAALFDTVLFETVSFMEGSMPPVPRFRREDLKPGESLCSHCTAKCCRYFALPIDKPTTWQDFDYLRWFMMHGRVALFVEGKTWYLMVYADCKHLLPDHRCGTYETRPNICRAYKTVDCEYDDDAVYDQFFETPEQIWEYAEAVLPPRRQRGKRNSLSVSLPILSSVS
jgi:Fe-S-cluster containining protein